MTIDEHLHFCLRLQRRLTRDPNQTFCWSPFSVANALCLAALGARGATRSELVAAVTGDARGDLDLQAKELAKSAAAAPSHPRLAQHRPSAWEVAVSNALWMDSNILLRPGFSAELELLPNGSINRVPFATSPQECRTMINRSVADVTRGLIPELLAHDDIGRDTVATLVSALYLRTSWRNPFDPLATIRGTFAAPSGPVEAHFMGARARMRYGQHGGWQIVDIPALGGVTATILLPDAPLAEAEPFLNASVLGEMLDNTTKYTVKLTLPRLALKFRTQLVPMLHALGVTTLFSTTCDLSGFCQDSIRVSTVNHEAVLRVDEHGMEGAAATSMGLERSMVPKDEVMVAVDRPFLLLVRRESSVFFSARVTRP